MYKRILGNVPVFGSDSKFGALADVNNKAIAVKDRVDFYHNDMIAYTKGICTLTPEVFNGALNYLTQLIGYVYAKGVPEFSLNVAYDKGAIVTFNGSLYVSLTNNNITHVSQTSHWGKFVIEPNPSNHNDIGSKGIKDSNPIGTILTVPTNTELEGYIDYVEGKTFSSTIYPELYKVLGTNQFAQFTHGSGDSSLPVGSIIHWLSGSSAIPDGYIEWSTQFGLLNNYPDLYNVLVNMANQLPLSDSKTAWLDALRNKSLPMFEASGFFLGYGNQVGLYTTDTVRPQVLQFAPMVVDPSNTLNPLGYNRCAEHKETVAPVNAQVVSQSQSEYPYVILANRAETHQDVRNKRMFQVTVGDVDANQTAPKQLAVRLLIKAVGAHSASISSTHKQIIKAY